MNQRDLGGVDLIDLSPREWFVVQQRFSLGNRKTLEMIGRDLGVSRERVRQIQVKALRHAAIGMRQLDPMLRSLESIAASASAAPQGLGGFFGEGPWFEEGTDSNRLLVLVRALTAADLARVRVRYPHLTLIAGSLGVPILEDPRVREAVSQEAENDQPLRDLTYRELALRVLRSHGLPMHWRSIAEEAEALRLRRSLNRTTFYNAIMAADDLFARVGPGTYALVESGYADVDSYPNLISSVLREQGEPMSIGQIARAMRERRPIKESSLQMFLDLNRRFYRSMNELYGLRDWIRPRHEQTLRSPAAFVEDAASYRRLSQGHSSTDQAPGLG